jgi:DNA ligase (NAD+)
MSDRIKILEEAILRAKDTYYAGSPSMEDAEFDALVDELRELDPENLTLASVGAPVPQDSKLQKVKHLIPMGSQNKVNTEAEFIEWAKKTSTDKFVLQEKLDGLSVELIYKDGRLTNAVTRGDGEEGEDVTHTVSKMQNVFTKLLHFTGSLRGEIIFPLSEFKAYSVTYANPRNAAAGITRRKEVSEEVAHLLVLFFDVTAEGKQFKNESDKIAFIQDALKSKTVSCVPVKLENAIKWYHSYSEDLRRGLDYEIDGLIIKVQNLAAQELLGEVDGRPKGQVAWKFAPEMRKTVLESVGWEVGLTGRITPVAHVRKTRVSGVDVENITLHNVSMIKKLGVYVGAEVLISRRGDVIPALEQVISKEKKPLAEHPKFCPVCDAPTKFSGEYLLCPNSLCPAKQKGDIKKWIKVQEIDQVGPAFVDDMIRYGVVTDVSDLYRITVEDLYTLEGYGEVSAKTIVQNIKKTKELPLIKFLAGLNIPNLSVATFATVDAGGFNTLEAVRLAPQTDLAAIYGIGDKTAQDIVEGLAAKSKIIDSLLKAGIKIQQKKTGPLTGKSFCFTGALSIKRGNAFKIVEDLGGEVKSCVSKGLTYLVQANANSTSTKSQKAKSYGTVILGEKEFMELTNFSFSKLKELAK